MAISSLSEASVSRFHPVGRPPAPFPRQTPLTRLQLFAQMRRNPLGTWMEVHFDEPFVQGRGLLGDVTVLSEPSAIKHVLVDNAENYRKDDLQLRILRAGLGQGLLTAEGDLWRRTRRTVAPMFTPKAVANYAARMDLVARVVAQRWRASGDHVLDVNAEMVRLTYEVLSETLFSNEIRGKADGFARAISHFFETQGRIDPFDILGLPDFVPRIGKLRARPALRFFEETVADIIAERREAIRTNPAGAPRDLLTALIEARDPETGSGLSEAELAANIVTFIGAGHETTANALTWALYLAGRTRGLFDALREEAGPAIERGDDPARYPETLPLTRAVLEEAMRLYPPAPTLTRAAIKPDRFGAVAFPRGGLVVMSPYVLHRHRKLWRRPDQFDPERFLPGQREGIDRFAYLPFGAGPRVCIGARFALMEAVIALAHLAAAGSLSYAGAKPPEPVQRVTLRPKEGMPMRFTAW